MIKFIKKRLYVFLKLNKQGKYVEFKLLSTHLIMIQDNYLKS